MSGELIFVGGFIGGQTNEMLKSDPASIPLPLQTDYIIQQNDATRIQQDYYEVKIKNPW